MRSQIVHGDIFALDMKSPEIKRAGDFFRLEHHQDRSVERLDLDRANGMIGTLTDKTKKTSSLIQAIFIGHWPI